MGERVPQYLSAPLQIFIFESDEMGIIMSLIGWVLIFGGKLSWICLILVPVLYRKAKMRYQKGFIKHLSYFVGLKDMHHYPGAFEKEFQE